MIVNQLKTRFRQAEPVTRELAALFQGAFQYYRTIRDDFLTELPSHLHGSELVTLVNVELKNRLFHPQFCEQVQEELKALRRTLIRLEDLREGQRDFTSAINDIEELARLGERAEALYQRHWEHYRYPTHLNEQALASLLLDIHRLCADWDEYYARFSAVADVVDILTGQVLPPDSLALRIAYTQAPPLHFSVGMLKSVVDFLEAGYAFVGAIHGLDTASRPLMLLQVDVSDPVELAVAVPAATHDAYVTFLQYLFLKDMLKRDALLKYVFEVVERQFGQGRKIDASAAQKDVAAKLKALPATGRFQISGRSFPEDQISVLQDLTASLERNSMDADALLGGEKAKAPRKGKVTQDVQPVVVNPPQSSRQPEPVPTAATPAAPVPPGIKPQVPAARPQDSAPQPRQHLHILTSRLSE